MRVYCTQRMISAADRLIQWIVLIKVIVKYYRRGALPLARWVRSARLRGLERRATKQRYAGQRAREHCVAQNADRLRPRETRAPCERDPAERLRRGERVH